MAAAAAIALLGARSAPSAAAPPKLPTPCLSIAACGVSPQALAFVQSGQAGAVTSGNAMTVNQSSATVILNWADFNIANGYSVTFNQPSSTAAALNRIWSAAPSVIAGALSANGQLFLINQNGIVFDKGAQINTGSLTAATLDIPDALFLSGVLSNNASLTQQNNTAQTLKSAFSGSSTAALSVNAGASLASADGGRIMLLGAKVSNQGNISTPDGQTILAAGNTVYLAASTDPALRGLLIEVKGNNPALNQVVNAGQISADRGNVTLAGMVVNQSGLIEATTSVSANGSIYLVAGDVSTSSNGSSQFYFEPENGTAGFGSLAPTAGGQLTLAAGSLTQVLPDPTDTGVINAQQVQNFIPSQVGLVGKSIVLEGNAAIRAPGANVSLTAAADPFNQTSLSKPPSLVPPQSDGSRIYLDAGSSIDVSGLANVPVPATQNLVQVKLEGDDLQDDPLLRNGFLLGQTVTVYVGNCLSAPSSCSTLFNLAPYVQNIQHGIAQQLVNGGTVAFDSNGDVITRAGSLVNVSGGSIAYQTASGAANTRLVGVDGKTYDIAHAPNDIPIVGLANGYVHTDPTWGVTSTSAPQTVYQGFVQGASAGSLLIQAPQLYLRGELLGQTTPGIYQRDPTALPAGGTLIIGDAQAAGLPGHADLRAPGVQLVDGSADALGSQFEPLTSQLPADAQTLTALSPAQLAQGGFTNLGLYSNGSITLAQGGDVALGDRGSLTAVAQSIVVDGRIDGPGSSVQLGTRQTLGTALPDNDILVAGGAAIDVSGRWVNDSPLLNAQAETTPTTIDGGTVSLQALGSVRLAAGSSIDVSGGGWVNGSNQLTGGAAGSITLAANVGADTYFTGVAQLSGTLLGASLVPGKGGSLAIASGALTVGLASSGAEGELLLPPGFFSLGGFASYELTGTTRVDIGTGGTSSQPVTINPLQENRVLASGWLLEPSGTPLGAFARLQLLPYYQRQPANISFQSAAVQQATADDRFGDVTLYSDSVLTTDPGAAIGLAAGGLYGNLNVLGTIAAPAGNVTLQLGSGALETGIGIGGRVLLLGPGADVSAPAYALVNTANPLGYRQGSVLSGGTVSLQAYGGSVVTNPSSTIDVSGTATALDLVGPGTLQLGAVVAGNAGSIDIEARDGLQLQGNLKGVAAPVAGAAGGSLVIGLDLLNHQSELDVIGSALDLRTLTLSGVAAAPAHPPGDGSAQLDSELIMAGGFDSIVLRSTDIIAFEGALSLAARSSLTIDAPELKGNPGAVTTLSAAHVALGNFSNTTAVAGGPSGLGTGMSDVFVSPYSAVDPMASATLAVHAQLIDVGGNTLLAGLADTALTSSGDLRLTFGQASTAVPFLPGALYTSGNLTLTAAQVYPTTATTFTIATPGSVTIRPAATGSAPAAPLSAGGNLTIDAAAIDQAGVLRAPLGELALASSSAGGSVTLESGSLTSVSGAGQIIPYGVTQNGQQWLYSTALSTNVVSAAPVKQLTIDAPSVSINAGAQLDLSGGGDLYAYEFIAGPGGSKDVLASASGTYTYAIVPSLASAFGPIDAQYQLGVGAKPGQILQISGVPGLPDGGYALLPADYALLPGAYAVQILPNTDLVAHSAALQPNGSYVAAGRLGVAGTDILDSRSSTIILTPDAVVRTQSQYQDSYADTFFGSAAGTGSAASSPAPIPAAAGDLQLDASMSLLLNGSVSFAPARYASGTDAAGNPLEQTGAGGAAAIVAPLIEVADPGASGVAGVLMLSADSLDALGAQTLILGASRATVAGQEQLTVGAQSILIANSAAHPLSAAEVLLAASGQVTLASGSAVAASGPAGSAVASTTLAVAGDGALLRIASGAQDVFVRSGLPGSPSATLSIGAATLSAPGGSLILDGAGGTSLDPEASLNASALTLSSAQINVGAVPATTPGLNLTGQFLARLSGLSQLTLRSAGTIDLYGALQIGAMSSGSPTLGSVTLDAAGLLGYGGGAKSLLAAQIALVNSGLSGTTLSASSADQGSLSLSAVGNGAAGTLTLGSGAKLVSGFDAVQLAASGDLRLSGSGTLTLANAGDLTLSSLRISADAGAQQAIANTSGAVMLQAPAAPVGVGAPSPLAPAGLGGSLSIIAAGNLEQRSGFLDLPAGVIALESQGGNLTLDSPAQLSAAGVAMSFSAAHALYAAAAAGRVSLGADSGNVTIASGASVDVSAATAPDGTSAAAGSLAVSAPSGQVQLAAGTLHGAAPEGQTPGAFTLDAGTVESLDQINLAVAGGGFQGAVSERVRNGAVTVDGLMKSASFTLEADGLDGAPGSGSITVNGTIDTRGTAGRTSGGNIALWAARDLTLAPGSALLASAYPSDPTASGGAITLGSESGTVKVAAGASLDLRGAQDGQLTLRAPRTADNTDVAVTLDAAPAAVMTAAPIIVEGVQVYTAGTAGSPLDANGNLTLDPSGPLQAQSAAFANSMAAAVAAGDRFAGFAVQVRPGIEIQSSGTITVSSLIDLRSQTDVYGDGSLLADNWRFNGVPVDLTVRAAGSLVFNGSLTDGFVTNGGALPTWSLAAGDSASYRLTAGADLTAASPLAVAPQSPGSGNFVLAPGNLIRTGTGSIDAAAGGSFYLGCPANAACNSSNPAYVATLAQQAVIYTAGVENDLPAGLFTPPSLSGGLQAAYPTGGGSITVTVAQNFVEAPTSQLISDWLWRAGSVNSDGTLKAGKNPSWWIDFGNFQQGVGALGGGNITVSAGGSIDNLSAVIPTTGRVAGAAGTPVAASSLIITGGGNLAVQSGGDIAGGVFEVGRGSGSVSAGGALTSGRIRGDTNPVGSSSLVNTPVYPIFFEDSGALDVTARAGIAIETVANSAATPELTVNSRAVGNAAAYFFTYGSAGASSVSLASAAGAISLVNDGSTLTNLIANASRTYVGDDPSNLLVYPSTVSATAFSAGIATLGSMSLFPQATGNLTLLAQADVALGKLTMYESDPTLVVNPLAPGAGGAPSTFLELAAAGLLPLAPLHLLDPTPVAIVAQSGSLIVGNNLTLPKPAELIAGADLDFLNLSSMYLGKNLTPQAVTVLEAGGDIVFATATSQGATAANQLITSSAQIAVGGPGAVEVLAGGSIDLGNGLGILTTGNLADPRLPFGGASLLVGAGLGRNSDGSLRGPDYADFAARYLSATATTYSSELIAYLAALGFGQLSYADALRRFGELSPEQRAPLLAQILYDELSAVGLAHTQQGASYQPGYDAIDTLFPSGYTYGGDINLAFSQLKTEQGGNVDLLVPGGSVIVGYPNPPAALSAVKAMTSPAISAAANLGVLVLGQGAIQGMASGSFEVNQSRMLTLEGGDIILWSSNGNIDAGRGAKSASGTPPPVIQTDNQGDVYVNPLNSVSGSGIGQLVATPGVQPGLVNLIAPKGTVDAGQAGIRVAGNLNVAALLVLGADNITVGGLLTGVPQFNAGALAGTLTGANALGDPTALAAAAIAQELAQAAASTEQATASLQPTVVAVKLFCIGRECQLQGEPAP